MRIAKRMIIPVLLALILLSIALVRGCRPPREIYLENDTYTIYVQSGQYSLVPKEPLPLRTPGMVYVVQNPSFYNLGDMKAAIINGWISRDELFSLQYSSTFCEEGFEICDISKLYTPTLPDGLSVRYITWNAITYNFKINEKCDISYVTPEYFDRMVKDYTEFEDKWEILSAEPDPSTGGTIYSYANKHADGTLSRTLTAVLYSITEGDKYLRILEDRTPPSTSIQIWGIENGVHFIVTIFDPQPHQTHEWLLSFGLEPYEDS